MVVSEWKGPGRQPRLRLPQRPLGSGDLALQRRTADSGGCEAAEDGASDLEPDRLGSNPISATY